MWRNTPLMCQTQHIHRLCKDNVLLCGEKPQNFLDVVSFIWLQLQVLNELLQRCEISALCTLHPEHSGISFKRQKVNIKYYAELKSDLASKLFQDSFS